MIPPTDAWRPYYVLAIATAANLLSYADRTVLAALVEPIKHELDVTDTRMGLLTGVAFALFYGAVALPVAWAADRFHRPRIVAAGIAFWSVMTSLTGMAQGFWHILVCRIGVGAGEAGNSPACHSLISDSFPTQRRPAAFAIFAAGSTVGMMCGLMAGGWIGQHYGWRMAFLAAGLPGFVLAALVWFTLRDPKRGGIDGLAVVAPESAQTTLVALAGNRTFVHLVMAYAFWIFLTYAVLQWMPALMIRKFGLGLSDVGFFFGVAFGLGSTAGSVLGGVLGNVLVASDVRRLLWLPVCSALAYLSLYQLALFHDNHRVVFATLFAAAIVCTLGVGAIFTALQAVVAPHRRATAAAVYGLVSSLVGVGGAPVVVGAMSDAFAARLGPAAGLQYAIAIALLVAVPMLFHLLRAGRTLRADLIGERAFA